MIKIIRLIKYRTAKITDVDFCVEAILQAEQSNSKTQPLIKIFKLSEYEIRKNLKNMLLEDLPGSEFSISAFTIAELDNKAIGACACWIEECEGISSYIIKSNLFNYFFPQINLTIAKPILEKIQKFQYEKISNNAYFEYLYIEKRYRRMDLLLNLLKTTNENALNKYPEIKVPAIYGGTSSNNSFMIRATRRIGYQLYKTIKLNDNELLNYIPSLTRYVMKKDI